MPKSFVFWALAALCIAAPMQLQANVRSASKPASPSSQAVRIEKADGVAEARLIEIYRHIGRAQYRDALTKASALVDDVPNFQLAQLVYGDLLAAQVRPVTTLGDISTGMAAEGKGALQELREESHKRLKAHRERPPENAVPSQFLALAQRSKHAIAVDASKARLYLFENSPSGLRLVSDYYISVGKAGISKTAEGDQRTPLGVYYISSNLDPKSLTNFYGSGALPINYPNVLDLKRGKTGSGIWLHGTPPNQFSRAPLATDGCVVLANPDLEHLIRTVEIRTTPVVIAQQLQWVTLNSIRMESKPFEEALFAWRNAKTSGNVQQTLAFYTQDFNSNGKTLAQWVPTLKSEISQIQGRTIQLKDVSMLRWTDTADTMVVTFGEVPEGTRTGWTKRQYWIRDKQQWKIFFEGVI